MNIALVVEASSGGAGRHVLDLAAELLSLGHSVHVLYGVGRLDTRFQTTLAVLAVDRRFRAQSFDWKHDISPCDLADVWRLAAYFRGHGPFDIVHGHSTKAGLLSRLAAALCGIPAVYTPHGVLSWDPTVGGWKRRMAAMLELGLSWFTSRIIAVSDCERRHLMGIRVAADKLALVRNGVSLDAYARLRSNRAETRHRLGLTSADLCVGFIGRLVPQKDPGLLLSAFARAAAGNPALRLVIVGAGPLLDELQRSQAACELGNRVRWCGALDGAELLPAFDCLALSSCTESLPYVVLEALATGIPVIATDVGGVSELVYDGRNGVLVPSGDIEKFAEAIAAVLSRREQLAAAAFQTAVEFDLASMASRTEKIYTEACSRRRGVRSQGSSSRLRRMKVGALIAHSEEQ